MTFRRLNTCLIPEKYNLEIIPDIESNTFSGTVQIHCKRTKNDQNFVELNCKNLTITSSKCGDQPINLNIDDKNERISFERCNNSSILTFTFYSNFNSSMKGFYKSSSENALEIASTLFCPTECRSVFPCFDEPEYKAVFVVRVVVKNSQNIKTVISNSNLQSSESKNNHTIYNFNPTPTMSTYLLCIVLGNYDYYENKTDNNTIVRCYTPPNEQIQGQFAVNIAIKAIQFYENYFKINYPLPKLDMIPISDVSVGAMEHWGIITYRDEFILNDPKSSSFESKQYFVSIIAHEIAHQWFGNLVTMKWWTDIWLNEGFATFMQFIAGQSIAPEYKLFYLKFTKCLEVAFNLDKLESSHPIEIEINNPDEIVQTFDAVSYCKGASIIEMLMNWIGQDNFQQGLKNYMKKYKFGNAETINLWQELEDASKMNVVEVMKSWTKVKGFPVLVYDGKTVKIDDKKHQNCWKIPLFYKTVDENGQKSEIKHVIMDTNEITLPDNVCDLNPNRTGFYRIVQKFETTFNLATNSPINRLKFLSDTFFAFENCNLKIQDYLFLVNQCKNETNYLVLNSLLASFNSICNIFGDPGINLVNNFLREHFTNEQKLLSLDDRVCSDMVIKLLCIDSCLNINLDKLNLNSPIPKLVKQIKTTKNTNQFYENYNKLRGSVKQNLGKALVLADDSEKVLKWITVTDNTVSVANKPYYLINLAARNQVSLNLVWKYLMNNLSKIWQIYDGTLFLSSRLFKGVISLFNDTSKVENFVKTHQFETARQAINQGFETATINEKLAKKTSYKNYQSLMHKHMIPQLTI